MRHLLYWVGVSCQNLGQTASCQAACFKLLKGVSNCLGSYGIVIVLDQHLKPMVGRTGT
jgi:hypothetical protein